MQMGMIYQMPVGSQISNSKGQYLLLFYGNLSSPLKKFINKPLNFEKFFKLYIKISLNF